MFVKKNNMRPFNYYPFIRVISFSPKKIKRKCKGYQFCAGKVVPVNKNRRNRITQIFSSLGFGNCCLSEKKL